MTDTASLEKALQATIERLVENRLESLRKELGKELQAEISLALAGAPGSAPDAALVSSSPAIAELNRSISLILLSAEQTEVMGALLQGAAAFAGRCALFVRRGDVFVFWRAVRFSDESTSILRSLSLPASQPGIIKELIDSQKPISRPRSPGVIPAILDRALGESADNLLYFFPVVVQGKQVAALYADAGSVAGAMEAQAVEILARVTGLSLEAATRAAAPGRSSAAAGAAETVTPKADVPIKIKGEPLQPASSVLESPEEIAAREEENAPPRGSFAASIPASSDGAPSIAPPPDEGSLAEQDREAHKKAHRFARVAVQDLLSYHKSKIEQGRKNKNLYLLLRDDIEKTRQNYRQRFGQTAARSFDYLHYELVLKLAANDPEALGAQYPGASEE
jgi:hypothetical protein